MILHHNPGPLESAVLHSAQVCHLCFSLLLAVHGEDPDLKHKFRQTRKVSVMARPEMPELTGQLSVRLNSGEWRRSWYRLHQGALTSQAGQENSQPAGSLHMADFTSVEAQGATAFLLTGGGGGEDLQLHFTADSQEDRDGWVEALSQCLATSNTSKTAS